MLYNVNNCQEQKFFVIWDQARMDIDDIKNDFEIGFRAARKPRLVSNQ